MCESGPVLDHHLHVWPHEPGTPTPSFDLLESYCEAAAARGITQIAITEHCHRFDRIIDEVLPQWERPLSGELAEATARIVAEESGADLDTYVAALEDAQRLGLPILIGLEVDHLPGAGEAMSAVLDEYPFDILLGSVHWLDDWLFDAYGIATFARQWEQRDTSEVFAHYVDSIIELARSGAVDVLAHLDVIKVAGYRPEDLQIHHDRLVSALAELNVAIEFSSAGLRKPANETYPSLPLLDQLFDAGLSLVTASDGHRLAEIGLGYDVLEAELDARNIETLTTFSRREPRPYQRRSASRS